MGELLWKAALVKILAEGKIRMKTINSFFFDCWSTLLHFAKKEEDWNTKPLKNHCLHPDAVEWQVVDAFTEDFFQAYYNVHSNYEIQIEQILNLIVRKFSISLDCPVEKCGKEVLSFLDPTPIPGADRFLSRLDRENLPYGIISNTVYPSEESFALVKKFFPGHPFLGFIASSDVGVKKPNPDFFSYAMGIYQRNPSQSIYIGDSYYQDIYGSCLAGFAFSIWLNPKGASVPEDLLPEKKEMHVLSVSSYLELEEKIFAKELIHFIP